MRDEGWRMREELDSFSSLILHPSSLIPPNAVPRMTLSLRYRLWLTFAPLLLLLTVLGVAAVLLMRLVGDRIDAILRENYRSVEAMAGLNEALERIDSSFQFSLLGQKDARELYGL